MRRGGRAPVFLTKKARAQITSLATPKSPAVDRAAQALEEKGMTSIRGRGKMLVMVIEHFKNRDAGAVYQRYRERGRMMPEGLKYIDSWVEPDYSRCFQLMECDDPRWLQQWTANWEDLVDFEIVPIVSSKEAADKFPSL